jgi:CheY-like chemotaxis protein
VYLHVQVQADQVLQEVAMGQAKPSRHIALVVEDDWLQRADIVSLLEESGMHVMQCESAEAALSVLDKFGGCLTMLFTDVNLAAWTA